MTLSDKCKAEMNQTLHSDKVVAVDEYSSIQGQTSALNIPVNLFLPAPEQVVNQDTPIKKNMTLEESLQNNKKKDILADIPSPFKNNLFWPDTPKVAKKLKEKIPSVATSKEWQEYFRKKENKKLEKEHEIEERKRKRLANKETKIKQETVLKKKKGVPKLNPKKPEDGNVLIETAQKETWFCSICKEEREEDMIKCQKCLQWMHEKCASISKKAKKFVCEDFESHETKYNAIITSKKIIAGMSLKIIQPINIKKKNTNLGSVELSFSAHTRRYQNVGVDQPWFPVADGVEGLIVGVSAVKQQNTWRRSYATKGEEKTRRERKEKKPP
ncbi:hypothetical protein FQR65_LT09171 [Abscondita terminalis]|nr:hypothetical protein FQR65_LT09171 [Abscondita terminalis]